MMTIPPQPDRTVLVIGASRGIGEQTVRAGLDAGWAVRGLSRHAPDEAPDQGAYTHIAGDARDPDTLAAALDGADAVCMTLGIPTTLATPCQRVTLFSTATEALLPAMKTAGVKRLVAVTGLGAGNSRAALSALERVPFGVALGHAYRDKDRQERLIADSPTDWTLVRPAILTKGRATGRYRVLTDPATWRNGLISRADVGDFLIAAIDRADLIGQKPVIAY